MKVCTVNVGTLIGKKREVAYMLERRSADICAVQEVRYKGRGSTTITAADCKYKFYYSGNDSRTHGVGLFIRDVLMENVFSVEYYSDRIMKVQMVLGRRVYHVFSIYAPQTGRSAREKEEFMNQLEDLVSEIPDSDGIVLAGDFNSHIGRERSGYEDIAGPYCYGSLNPEGRMLLDFCKYQNLKIANTYFKKDREKLITFKSGDAATQIDFVLWRPIPDLKILDCKVIPGEECLTQHRLLRADFKFAIPIKKKWKGMKRLRVWKLKDQDAQTEFSGLIESGLTNYTGSWDEVKSTLLEAAEQVCGRTSGKRGHERETWWWSEELQESIKQKHLAFKKWQRTGRPEDKRTYKIKNNQVKHAVRRAKRAAWVQWSVDLNTVEGKRKMFKMAKQIRNKQVDIVGTNYIRGEDGNLKICEREVSERWRGYFNELLNQEYPNDFENVPATAGPIEELSSEEVREAINSIKVDKAPGPSEITSEMFKYTGEVGIDILTDLFRTIINEGRSPSQWSESITIPLYKGKGDALCCNKYRGLRLLEHCMKIYEKVLMNRLERITEVGQNQFGFTSGRSTTDAIHILRRLQEKYLQKNNKLYHIFVDLEKAFDRVPRQAIEWALRRKCVPEKLVQLITGLYADSKSRVRAAGVLSESFPVQVGVHQGSVMSPFLFNIIVDEATKECRSDPPWAMLYADDLVLTSETKGGVVEMFNTWRAALAARGLRVNLDKTKLLVSGKKDEVVSSSKFPCAVCGAGVGCSSRQCMGCNMWCHLRCSGFGSYIAMRDARTFVCKSCTEDVNQNPDDEDESIQLPDGVIEEVRYFCYLGDVLQRGGGAERAVRTRISLAWARWRELSPLLRNGSIPIKARAEIYGACVRTAMLYGGETWALTKRLSDTLRACDRRMLRMVAGVSLGDGTSSAQVLEICQTEGIEELIRRRRLLWYGHTKRRPVGDPLQVIDALQAPGRRPAGGSRKTWYHCVQTDLRVLRLNERDTEDRDRWHAAVYGARETGPTPRRRGTRSPA